MSKLKIAWLALLLILFGAFWYWYGGSGDPLSVEEGTAMLDEIEAAHEAAGTSEFDERFPGQYRSHAAQ